MFHPPRPVPGNPQPPTDWLTRFSDSLFQLHPDADAEQSLDIAAQLWAVDTITPEAAAQIVAALLPDDDE
jgi:hypothetical protein